MNRVLDVIVEFFTDVVTIPPVVTGNRLEIHTRLSLLLESEGAAATASSWTDGCRMLPSVPTYKSIKGSRGKKVK